MSAHTTDVPDGVLPWQRTSANSVDQTHFEQIYLVTARPLLAYLLGVTGRRDVADDLLQETFVRFLARQPAAMPEVDTRRYLFRIATNLLRDRWRRHDTLPAPTSDQADIEPRSTPDLENQLDIRRAMHSLKPRERELLWLAYVEGMSHAEIAAVTGLNTLSIRLLLFRARAKAATLLNPDQPVRITASGKATS